jgi:gamma-glutamylcyclotransferase (GGCT)/AIG2-like uncharacterized protein YtfP
MIEEMERAEAPKEAADPHRERSPRHLFVYGTLLSSLAGPGNPSLRGWTTLVGPGRITGRLFDAGAYPAAVLSEEGTIRGELHEIRGDRVDSLLDLLDAYEQYFPERPHASLFVRRLTEVERPAGDPVPAWIYGYNQEVEGLTRIDSGDYALYRAARGSGGWQ